MKFYGLKVNDLEESIIASGLPMREEDYTPEEWEAEVGNLKHCFKEYGEELIKMARRHKKEDIFEDRELEKAVLHIKRALGLGKAAQGSGHDCACKGIIVSVNIKADQSFWLQWERYHFQDTVSSMSTMHRILKFDVDKSFSEYVDPRSIEILKEKIAAYEKNKTPENFHQVIHNIPEGIELTRRVTTNYLQLKTMYHQRKSHKMFSWNKDFVRLCDELPYFYELIGINKDILRPCETVIVDRYLFNSTEEWEEKHDKIMSSAKYWFLGLSPYGERFIQAEYERK